MFKLVINQAQLEDMPAVQAIYAKHVTSGLGTFEEIPPSLEEMTTRYIKITSSGFPFIVARMGLQVVGYAYANHFRERSAYRFSVEDSIYIAPGFQGQGIGLLLLQSLIQLVAANGFKQILAVIGDSNNQGSIGLHQKLGFKHVGIMQQIGYKFEQFVDVVIMQLKL